jgi:Ca2+/Na+ antiporter
MKTARFFPLSFRDSASPLYGGLFLSFVVVVLLGASGPWGHRMGLLALVLPVFLICSPPVVRHGKAVAILALGFLLLSLASYLPAAWFPMPEWRKTLQGLGVETGELVVIQRQQAFEHHLAIALLFLVGLWMLGQRFQARTTANLALAFVLVVAGYTLLSKTVQGEVDPSLLHSKTLGFLPNRNHSSNFFSLGLICGVGALVQALRNKERARATVLFAACGMILWTILSWNLSRSGVILSGVGALAWFLLLGIRYFGSQERKVIALAVLLVVGGYALAEFQVKDRISDTIEKVTGEGEDEEIASMADGVRMVDFDFRVPVYLDTLDLIADAPLTGVGAGQFRWVFPQYRQETIVAERAVALHPESSWLWLVADFGLPATLCVLALVVLFFVRGIREIRRPGHRARALRFGCLVASALVPLHGFFDVPAHRPSLYLASLFLFALSQHPPEEVDERRSRPWPVWLLAIGLFLAGLRLVGSSWFGWAPPAIVQSDALLSEGAERYRRVSDRQDPLPPLEALEQRQELLPLTEEARQLAPLDGRFYRLAGLAALPLAFKADDVVRDLAIDRALTPHSVTIPLIHANAAALDLTSELENAWQSALERAQAIDARRETGDRQVKRVERAIDLMVRKNRHLAPVAERVR